MTRFPSHGPLPEALREWCKWIQTQADLAHRAAQKRGGMILPDGSRSESWLDHCGMYERRLVEAAMWSGIFEPVEDAAE